MQLKSRRVGTLAQAGCLLLLAGLLTACGGGDGGDAGGSPGGGGAGGPTATAPTIATQPANLAISDGQAATFAVTASGSAPLSYQWQANGAPIAGATSESYVHTAAILAHDGTRYTVTVSNSAGSVNSNPATLTVNPIPAAIAAAPQPVSVTVGQPALFSVTASGSAPLALQWTRDGADIAGATAASLTLAAVTLADGGARFAVRVSNAGGSVTSPEALLNVAPIAPGIVTQPADLTVSVGQAALFSVTASGSDPLTYQWLRDGVPIPGATLASFTLSGAALTDSGAQFTVHVGNAAGTASSSAAVLTVAAIPPSIAAGPQPQTVIDGASATFSVVASGTPPLHYQWRKNGAAVGGDAPTLTLASVTTGDSGATITVIVSNPSPIAATSNGALLTVSPRAPAITVQPQAQTAADGATATFSVTATGTPTLHYQWKRGGTNVGADSATYTTPALTLTDSGASYTVVVSNAATTTATSSAASLTVTPIAPSIVTQPLSQSVAAGATATFTVTAAGSATLSYQWKRNGTNVGTNSPTFTTPALTLADSGASYVVVVSNTATTTATSNAAILTVTPVAPSIVTHPQSQAVAAGAPATFTVTATGTAPLHYQWKRDGSNVGTDSASYTTAAAVGADSGAGFTVTVSNAASAPATSNTAILTVISNDLQVFAGAIGGAGYTDGTGSAARFINPLGIAVDSSGNAYIADKSNQLIRRVTPAGVVTTLAGSAGVTGFVNNTGTAARFDNPTDLAVYEPTPGDVHLFIADSGNHAIRELVVATLAVSTLAGSGASGTANGTGGSARFNTPGGITLSGGELFVADTNNHTVRRVTLAGAVTTLAGSAGANGSADGTGGTARFYQPLGLAADATGTLYVADNANCIVRSVSMSTGAVTTLAGTAGNFGNTNGTTPASARFNCPSGLVVDTAGTNLYVSDPGNRTVRRIVLPAGTVTTYAGAAGVNGAVDGPVGTARFARPYGLTLDPNGDLLMTDAGNFEVRRIDLSGNVVSTLAGSIGGRGYADGTGGAARFSDPHNIAIDSAGNFYVSDFGNAVIRKVTPAGVVTTLAGSPGNTGTADGTGSAARFGGPRGLAVDSAGNVFVADAANNSVRQITPGGVVTTFAGSTAGTAGYANLTGTAALFRNPVGVAVDSTGNVYVSDFGNNAIRMISPAAVVSTLAGDSTGVAGSIDGVGTAARFRGPRGVAFDVTTDNVVVADRDNGTVRLIASDGTVSTLAGLAGNSGYANGLGSSARFDWPNTPALDSDGNIYVPDANNSAIRKITPTGLVTTVVGPPPPGSPATVVLGALPGRLNTPSGVAVIPGTPVRLVIAESAENALLLATIP